MRRSECGRSSASGRCSLRGDWELWGRRDDRAGRDVHVSEPSWRRILDVVGRSDESRLQSLRKIRSAGSDVGGRSGNWILQSGRIAPLLRAGRILRRSSNRILQHRCEASDLRRGRERGGRDGQSWLLDVVGPGHDIGHSDIRFQLDLGWRDNRLRAIVSLAWNRNNGLA